MKLKDRVALITGGSTGIGRAAAVAMAREGANIALTARRAERCEEAVAEIEGLGGQALALPGDVANADHVAELVAATVERWGRLDIVVPNAGINGVFAPIEDITPEEWDQTPRVPRGHDPPTTTRRQRRGGGQRHSLLGVGRG